MQFDFGNYFFVKLILHLTSLNEKKVYLKCFHFNFHAVWVELPIVNESIQTNQVGKKMFAVLFIVTFLFTWDIGHSSKQAKINSPERSVQQ